MHDGVQLRPHLWRFCMKVVLDLPFRPLWSALYHGSRIAANDLHAAYFFRHSIYCRYNLKRRSAGLGNPYHSPPSSLLLFLSCLLRHLFQYCIN
jgi:hypothetical protein